MAAGTSPIFYAAPKISAVQIANADGTTKKTLVTAGANGCLVFGIEASTTDTANNDVGLYIQIGGSGTDYPIGGKRVPLGSGDATAANPTAAINLLDVGQMPFLLPDGSLQLGPNDILKAAVQTAVTSAKTLTLVAQAGDF